ncbi:winged helix-turn-helix domain-containing protein [Compostimonas suwonensis]|uniref:Winged helix-turn-helix protein n=1 Tax=Compostimonas suwonensis TaxID=1048394 RepID=A0A2M9BW70_9MICO|nr:crosslink repair DNA glycosylase YcaQ family protein [Compostimonas suwonensis]PJJ62202.1 hypothetical protein CLV54_1999 [Compostimonas suwonensis]
MAQRISSALARRIALAAQGFGRPRPETIGTRQLNTLIERINLLQIDSVNVFERSHYLPVFARLGGYDKALLDALTFTPKTRYLEYWAHVAAIIPRDDLALLRWRMQEYRRKDAADPGSWANANASMLDWLRAELAEKGPMAASEIEHEATRRRGPWWGWSDAKRGLESLFIWGDVVTAGRTRFERRYALPEQVLPAELIEAHVEKDDAVRELVLRSARAHGIGTAGDFADYYRIGASDARRAIRDLEDGGQLVPVVVEGWERGGRPLPAWLHREARLPRRIDATALLTPFDPVVWQRDRALRLFDFHYRIEIYTPAPKRVFGYYVLPLLVDDRVVGRVDLKNDRQAGVLRVRAAWREEGAPPQTAERLAEVLRQTAAWQGLGEIAVVDRGTLAREVALALGVRTTEFTTTDEVEEAIESVVD